MAANLSFASVVVSIIDFFLAHDKLFYPFHFLLQLRTHVLEAHSRRVTDSERQFPVEHFRTAIARVLVPRSSADGNTASPCAWWNYHQPVVRGERGAVCLLDIYIYKFQGRAWEEIREGVLLAARERLPAELMEVVFEWVLVAERIPGDPRVYAELFDGGEERLSEGIRRPLPGYLCGRLTSGFSPSDGEASARMREWVRELDEGWAYQHWSQQEVGEEGWV